MCVFCLFLLLLLLLKYWFFIAVLPREANIHFILQTILIFMQCVSLYIYKYMMMNSHSKDMVYI